MRRFAVSAIMAVFIVTALGSVADPGPTVAQTPDVEVAAPGDVVVDDVSAGFRRVGPGWRASLGGYANHHFWLPARRTQSRIGIWSVTFDEPGLYAVSVKIPGAHASSRKAAYKIKTQDGWVQRVRNQYANRNAWMDLGTFRLAAKAEVRLSDKTLDSRGSRRKLAFDAVRFVPLDPPDPPVITRLDVEPKHDRAIVTFSLEAKGPARTDYREAGTTPWSVGANETSSKYADQRQVVTGLKSETDYELRVVATNLGGETVSPIVRFTTLAPPPPVIKDINVEPADQRVVVRFSLDKPGPARTEYRRSGASDWRLGAEETSYKYADHRQVITGLSPETDYLLRTIATNAGGKTVSDVLPFRTLPRVVDCGDGDDLPAAVRTAKTGDTLLVKGTCNVDWDSGMPELDKDLTIKGVGDAPTLQAPIPGTALSIASGATVVISDLRLHRVGITNAGSVRLERLRMPGSALTTGVLNSGDAVVLDTVITEHEQAIDSSRGSVTLTRSTITDCYGGDHEPEVFNRSGSSMILRDSEVSQCLGAVRNEGSMELEGTRILRNSGDRGGGCSGIGNSGSLIIRNSTLKGNTSEQFGGALCNSNWATVTDSLFANNTAATYGGAIYNTGEVRVYDSSITGNRAGTTGGGIYNQGSITIQGSTVEGNTPNDCVGC